MDCERPKEMQDIKKHDISKKVYQRKPCTQIIHISTVWTAVAQMTCHLIMLGSTENHQHAKQHETYLATALDIKNACVHEMSTADAPHILHINRAELPSKQSIGDGLRSNGVIFCGSLLLFRFSRYGLENTTECEG